VSRKDPSLLPPLSFPDRFYNFLFEKSSAEPRRASNPPPPTLSFSFFTLFVARFSGPARRAASRRARDHGRREIVVIPPPPPITRIGIPLRNRTRRPRRPGQCRAPALRERAIPRIYIYIYIYIYVWGGVGTLIQIYRDQ